MWCVLPMQYIDVVFSSLDLELQNSMFFGFLQLSQLHFDQGTGVPSGKMSDTLTLFQLQKMLLEEYGKEEH